MRLKVTKPYLRLPFREWRKDTVYCRKENLETFPRVELYADDRLVFSHRIPLAVGEPDWYGYLNVSAYLGREIELRLPETGEEVELLLVDEVPAPDGGYQRPDAHFSYREGHMGDVTALTWWRGQWHFFSIYTPFDGAEIAWGHAVSDDMVHWTELPPFYCGEYLMYNGAGYVDENDVFSLYVPVIGMGLCRLTTEDGVSFPWRGKEQLIIDHGDAPRFFQDPGTGLDSMFLKRDFRKVEQYRTRDWKTWEQDEDFPAIAEMRFHEGDPCEKIFELPLDGNPDRMITVMYFGMGGYCLGGWQDGRYVTLTGNPIAPDDLILDYHYGFPTFFANAPDNRKIAMNTVGNAGFGGMPNFEHNYPHAASFPVEFQLLSTHCGPRLAQLPVKEIEGLYQDKKLFAPAKLDEGQTMMLADHQGAYHIRLSLEHPQGVIDVAIGYMHLLLDMEARTVALCCDGSATLHTGRGAQYGMPDSQTIRRASLYERPGTDSMTVELVADHTSVEAFVQDGLIAIQCGRLCFSGNEGPFVSLKANKTCVISEGFIASLNGATR